MRWQPCIVVLLLLLMQASALADMAIDDANIESLGIRSLQGKHITLYTDLTGPEIDELPDVFDRAFMLWCRYFQVDPSAHADWRLTACLMKDKEPFEAAGLLPDDLPPFEHGYSVGDRLWLYEQPSEYYRRHLFLHEGTHGFMRTILGGYGPLWYMEGMAEFFGTHRIEHGRLEMGIMPRNREETPMWGRIRILQDAVAQQKTLSLQSVIALEPEPRRENDLYAWCWAAATFFERHPRYQERFHELMQYVAKPESEFVSEFHKRFDSDWMELSEEWQLMIDSLEYGYDVARCEIDFTPGRLLEDATAQKVTVAADRGWQNSRIHLEAGRPYHITATGRYQIAQGPVRRSPDANEKQDATTIWWSEPNGVSVRYYRGHPLGVLLAAVRPDGLKEDGTSALLNPTVIGLEATLVPDQSGTLYFKVNDSPGEFDDNAGELTAEVRQK